MKGVDDHRVVAPPVVPPRLLSHFLCGEEVETVSFWKSGLRKQFWANVLRGHLVWSSISIPQLDVLFVLDSVEVLVQAVQQEGQQLLAVVLLVAQELRGKVAHLGLQGATECTELILCSETASRLAR